MSGYMTKPLSPFRRQVVDYFVESQKTPSIRILFELDITEARKSLRQFRRVEGRPLALSSFLLYVFAITLDKHRDLQAHILRGRRLVIFDNVDVSTVVERPVGGSVVPTSYVLREAQKKSPLEIEEEIASARGLTEDAIFDVSTTERPGGEGPGERRWSTGRLAARLPRPLRRLAIRHILRRNPFAKKRLFGTCSFSAAHMFGQGYGFGLPVTPHPIHMLVGGIETRVGDTTGTERYIACVTLTLDHNIADAAPAIRFINDFKRRVGAGVGSS